MVKEIMSKKRGLLAVVMALAMVFAATTILVDEADAEEHVPVAQVGDVKYTSLQGAINAATDGQTVTILTDIMKDKLEDELVRIHKAITIDGGNNIVEAYFEVYTDGVATIKDCIFQNVERAIYAGEGDEGILYVIGCDLNNFKLSYNTDQNGGMKIVVEDTTDIYLNSATDLSVGSTETDVVITGNSNVKTIELDTCAIEMKMGLSVDKMIIEGACEVKGDSTLNVAKVIQKQGDGRAPGKIEASANFNAIETDIPVSGNRYVTEYEYETVTLSGVLESDIAGKVNQIITVTDDLVVKPGVTITVLGQFVVESDATVEFQKGSSIQFMFGSESAIDGDITVQTGAEEAPTMVVSTGASMDVVGSVVLDGAYAFSNKGTVDIMGYFEVSDVASADLDGTTIGADGELMVYGVVSGDIVNNGTITIDSEGILNVGGTDVETEIEGLGIQLGADATVEVVNLYGTVIVSDSALQFKTEGKMKDVKNDNTVKLTNVKDVTVDETLVIKTENNIRVGQNTMSISGDIGVADDAVASSDIKASVAIDSDEFAIPDDMVLEAVAVSIKGKVTVSSNVDATATDALISVQGTLVVTGTITMAKGVEISGSQIDAAMYSTPAPNAYNIYTTLENALAAGATDITVTGDVEIASDVTVPVGTKINAADAVSVTVKDGATVTVQAAEKKSGVLKNDADTPIAVEGTLVVENLAKSGLAAVVSDTSKASGDSVTYTNVYNALADAAEGDVVKITKNGGVELSKDLTVPVGVALEVPNGNTLTANNNVTVTVDGTLDIEGTYVVDEVSGNGKAAVTAINGIMQFADEDSINTPDKYTIAGAYFGYDGAYAVAPLATAAGLVNEIESEFIALKGDMTVGDIAFDYTGDDAPALVVENKLTAGTIDIGPLEFNALCTTAVVIKATVALTNGSVILENVTGVKIADSVRYDVDNNEIYTAGITGTNVVATDGSTTTTSEKGSIGIVGEVVSSVTDIDENVTVNVPAGSKLTMSSGNIDTIVIEGTVSADAGSITTATVMGTLTTGEGKSVNVTKLFVGVLSADIIDTTVTGTATVTDKVLLVAGGLAYVAPGSVVGEGITKANNVKVTEYYFEEALYVTAYTTSANVKIDSVKADLENAEFIGWFNSEKTPTKTGSGSTATYVNVGEDKFGKVYAKVDYEIFTLTVSTVPGTIVYVDGVKWVEGEKYAAGAHEIAVYLQAGYEGTPVVKVNGTEVNGTFDITGEETVITVSGVTASSGSVVIQPSEAEDEGLGLTDILLIVLVVLIVIMAVIVALRLMRS